MIQCNFISASKRIFRRKEWMIFSLSSDRFKPFHPSQQLGFFPSILKENLMWRYIGSVPYYRIFSAVNTQPFLWNILWHVYHCLVFILARVTRVYCPKFDYISCFLLVLLRCCWAAILSVFFVCVGWEKYINLKLAASMQRIHFTFPHT